MLMFLEHSLLPQLPSHNNVPARVFENQGFLSFIFEDTGGMVVVFVCLLPTVPLGFLISSSIALTEQSSPWL